MSGIQRKGRFKSNLIRWSWYFQASSWISLTHLEHLKPWVQGTGPGVYRKPFKLACVTNRNGQQKQIFWNLKRLWKVLHTLRDHHTNVVHSGPLVCYSTLLEETSFITSIFISPDSACTRKVCKEHFRTRNIFWTEINQVDYIRQQKG